MANLRFLLIMSKYQNGIQEGYYFVGDPANLLLYRQQAIDLATKRMSFAGAQTFCKYVRINNADSPGESFRVVMPNTSALSSFKSAGIQGTGNEHGTPGTVGNTDFQDTALLASFNDVTARRRKSTFLRGNVDSQVDFGGQYLPDDTYRATVQGYLDYLASNSSSGSSNAGNAYGPYGWLRAGLALKPKILGVTQNIDGTVTLALGLNNYGLPGLQAPALPNPNPTGIVYPIAIPGTTYQMAVRKVSGAFQINGVKLWNVDNLNQVTSAQRISIFAASNLKPAYLRFSQKLFVAIGNGSIARVDERKAGRPSYQSASKQKAKAQS